MTSFDGARSDPDRVSLLLNLYRPQGVLTVFSNWSGRKDLNLRPLGSKPSTLTKLSYAQVFATPWRDQPEIVELVAYRNSVFGLCQESLIYQRYILAVDPTLQAKSCRGVNSKEMC